MAFISGAKIASFDVVCRLAVALGVVCRLAAVFGVVNCLASVFGVVYCLSAVFGVVYCLAAVFGVVYCPTAVFRVYCLAVVLATAGSWRRLMKDSRTPCQSPALPVYILTLTINTAMFVAR